MKEIPYFFPSVIQLNSVGFPQLCLAKALQNTISSAWSFSEEADYYLHIVLNWVYSFIHNNNSQHFLDCTFFCLCSLLCLSSLDLEIWIEQWGNEEKKRHTQGKARVRWIVLTVLDCHQLPQQSEAQDVHSVKLRWQQLASHSKSSLWDVAVCKLLGGRSWGCGFTHTGNIHGWIWSRLYQFWVWHTCVGFAEFAWVWGICHWPCQQYTFI